MADPILHIKDSYYFEVPKVLWPAHYKSIDELPPHLDFLKHDAVAHHATIADVNHELSGKIVIPQPFGKLSSFYSAESGFCISKFMIIELAIAALIVFIFTKLAPKVASGLAPKGFFWNMFEASLLFIRDGIARPAIDSHDEHDHTSHAPHDQEQEDYGVGHIHGAVHKHDGDRFLPILWTMFFFVLLCNLGGMLPWVGAPTGSFSVTLALACCTFATTLIAGIIKFGPIGFWKNQVPTMDLPTPIAIFLKPMIFAIELLGLVIKHGVLAIRLLANMVAGHLVLLSILGLIVIAAEANASTAIYGTVSFAGIVGSTLLSCLELFVCFLQAYVFTFLSALFIGAAVHQH
ncbi:MAG: F0F1 ATP synthase subunit A [Planctomycetia bacterium]|nr:F0F1 ATP synthase subunit A [Planctomycetia bacterium]